MVQKTCKCKKYKEINTVGVTLQCLELLEDIVAIPGSGGPSPSGNSTSPACRPFPLIDVRSNTSLISTDTSSLKKRVKNTKQIVNFLGLLHCLCGFFTL